MYTQNASYNIDTKQNYYLNLVTHICNCRCSQWHLHLFLLINYSMYINSFILINWLICTYMYCHNYTYIYTVTVGILFNILCMHARMNWQYKYVIDKNVISESHNTTWKFSYTTPCWSTRMHEDLCAKRLQWRNTSEIPNKISSRTRRQGVLIFLFVHGLCIPQNVFNHLES